MSDKAVTSILHRTMGIAFALSACLSAYCIGNGNGIKAGIAQEKAAVKREAAAAQVATDAAAAALQTKIDQLAGQAAQTETARQAAARENRNASQAILARPLYRTVCVDADGVRLLDQAADIANGNPSSQGLTGPVDAAGATAEAPAH